MILTIYKTLYLTRLCGWMTLLLSSLLLLSCSQSKHENYSHLLQEYNEAHDAQGQGNLDKAAMNYRDCIAQCSNEQYIDDDSVKQLLPKAMVQLMNTFQSQGKQGECVAYFDSLKREVDEQPTIYNKVLQHYFKRDVYVLLAYSLSRTDDEARGVKVMDEALTMPLYNANHERLFRDYAYAAGVYYCVPSTQAEMFKYGRKALDEVKKSPNKSGAQWLVTMLGSMYHRTGKVDEAIRMYQEGYELATMAKDTLGMANAKKEMADYLLQWHLDSIANRYATEAVLLIDQVANDNPMVKTGVLVTKAKILKKMHRKAEALSYLRKAKQSSVGLPYNSGVSDIGVLMGSLLVTKASPCHPADFKQGMDLLEKASHDATYKIKATAFYEIAKVELSIGRQKEGEAALDSMYAILNTATVPFVIDGAYDFALNHYLNSGNHAKEELYTKALQRDKQQAEQAASIKNVIHAITQLEIESKEHSMQEHENNMDKQKNIVLGIIGLLAFVVLGLGVLYLLMQKRNKRKHRDVCQELSQTQQELNEAMTQRQKMEAQLANLDNEKVRKVKSGQSLITILKESGDEKFRKYFELAYPAFVGDLRKVVPSITRKEELYCMLIALGQDNAELAAAFSIARSSVNIAKSRLRKKLPEEERGRLEAFLTELLKGKNE